MNTNGPRLRKPLRLWPGVAGAVLLVIVGYVVPIVVPAYAGLAMIWAALCALLLILWWLFFSRARWYERVGAVVLMIAAVIAERPFVHASIAGGAMGNLSYILAIPTLSVALVAWAWVEPSSRTRRPGRRGGCRCRARMSAVAAATDRWHQRQREIGLPLAVDQDSRGAAPRSSRRGAPRRCSGRAQVSPGSRPSSSTSTS